MLSGADKIAIMNAMYEVLGLPINHQPLAAVLGQRIGHDMGLDSLDVFELLLRVQDIAPDFEPLEMDLDTDMSLAQLFDKVDKQLKEKN